MFIYTKIIHTTDRSFSAQLQALRETFRTRFAAFTNNISNKHLYLGKHIVVELDRIPAKDLENATTILRMLTPLHTKRTLLDLVQDNQIDYCSDTFNGDRSKHIYDLASFIFAMHKFCAIFDIAAREALLEEIQYIAHLMTPELTNALQTILTQDENNIYKTMIESVDQLHKNAFATNKAQILSTER